MTIEDVLVDSDASYRVAVDQIDGKNHQMVKLVDGTDESATRSKIADGTTIVEADPALAVKDATVGLEADGAVEGDAAGTVSGKLRGLGKSFGTVDDAAATAGGTGTVSAKLRGLSRDLGAQDDAEASGNGSSIGLLKRLRTLLAGGLPAALTGGGNLKVSLEEQAGSITLNTELPAAAALADAAGNATTPTVGAAGLLWNGATWDRARGAETFTVLSSATRTATTDSADFTTYNTRGVMLFFDITTFAAASSLTLAVQAKDPVSNGYRTITAFATLQQAVDGVGLYVYTIYPGASETLDAAGSFVQALSVPRTWRVRITHSNGSNQVYSVGASRLP